jgi:hypothetical protein
MNDQQRAETLLGRYWDLAYHEGKTGESCGSEANEVLCELRQLLEQPTQGDKHED